MPLLRLLQLGLELEMTSCGVGSTVLQKLPRERLTWYSWNARALLPHVGKSKVKKMRYLDRLLQACDLG
eukprot:5727385-Karenia_brevis.AAC.1